MSPFTWNQRLETGNAMVDEQHQRLFELAGVLQSAVDGFDCGDDPLGDAVYELTEYCLQHFADEEALMEGAGYPELGAHRELHRVLTARTTRMSARYFNGEDLKPDELAPFVVDWLTSHILAADQRFVDWLATNAG